MARTSVWYFGSILALTLACGGGGGGGGGSATSAGNGDQPATGGGGLDEASDFFLAEAHFARVITDLDGALDAQQPLVHPATLLPADPFSGLPLADQLEPLSEGTPLDELVSLRLDQISDPFTPVVPVVPRNAGVVLTFSRPLDSAHVAVWAAVQAGEATAPGSQPLVEVTTADGAAVPLRLALDPTDPRRLVLLGVTPLSVGWPATPLAHDALGHAVQPPGGFLRVVLRDVRAADGTPYSQRPDLLGSVARPLPFDPGNAELDPMTLQTDTVALHFGGFLPDLQPPRLVRAVETSGQLGAVGAGWIRDLQPTTLPASLAQGGLGEWAGALLEITSPLVGGESLVTRYRVGWHADDGTSVTFHLADGAVLDPRVGPGDGYRIERSEAYEPIATTLDLPAAALAPLTVDPLHRPRDPFDPQDLLNSDLRHFVRVFDEDGVERTDRWDPASSTFLAIPPRSVLQLTFDEPMDPSSLRAYESLSVRDGALPVDDPAWQDMRIGRVTLSADGRVARFEPVLEDQRDGSERFVGFGGTPATHRLVLRTRVDPRLVADLEEVLTPELAGQLHDLELEGVIGLSDVTGRGLGLPAAMTDPGAPEHFLLTAGSPGHGPLPPAVDLGLTFETLPSNDPDFGAVVHRFMGSATTGQMVYPEGSLHDAVTDGVEYADLPPLDVDGDGQPERRFLYGPTLLEVGLNVPGHLTGAPSAVFEHVVDDFNKPKPSPFASPNGEDFLIGSDVRSTVPLNSGFGARMQHIYRAGDASPAQYDFRDVWLDLVGLSWAPYGDVTNTTLDDFQLLVGLSGVNAGRGPSTKQVNGNPLQGVAESGLKQQFDCNLLENRGGVCDGQGVITGAKLLAALPDQPTQTTVVVPGTAYAIDSKKLFRPANASGLSSGFRLYLDYPEFNAGVDPFFGRDDVNAFPYDSNFPMLIEYRVGPNESMPASNSIRLSPGIFSSNLPRFRVWSQGQHPLAGGVPNYTAGTAPANAFDFWAGEGGPLVDPGRQTQAIQPPDPNNGMPVIPFSPGGYEQDPAAQPVPTRTEGVVDADSGCITELPTVNANPHSNFYFANGMLLYPLPDTTPFPGPGGLPPTRWAGYGPPVTAGGDTAAGCVLSPLELQSNNPAIASIEPSYAQNPDRYGDNSRYYMIWKYRKRVSRIESPTLAVQPGAGGLRWHPPVVSPPPAAIPAGTNRKLEVRIGGQLDFALSGQDSGYVDGLDPQLGQRLDAVGDWSSWIKFRATFGSDPGQASIPTLDTVVLPYERLP